MTLDDNASPAGRALQAVGAAGIELPPPIAAALAVQRDLHIARLEELPAPPALPGRVDKAAATITAHIKAVTAHAAATAKVEARRQVAADLEPIAAAQVARAVGLAVPEMTAAVVDAFNERWQHFIANPDLNPVGQASRLDRLYDARHALGALAGERLDQRIEALVVFAVTEPRPGQIEGRPLVDVLYRWGCFNPAPLTRWRDSLPQLPVEMVDLAGVAPRLAALQAWTASAPLARPSARAGALYDRPLPYVSEPEAAMSGREAAS